MRSAKDHCIHCGSVLRRYAHWGICANCDPKFYKEIFPEPVVPVDPLKHKGVPSRNGQKYV